MLRTARTVIVDEIHAVIGTRRGAHLALTLERLQQVAERAAATDRAVGDAAADRRGRALPGRALRRALSATACAIVDEGHRRAMDLALEVPRSALDAVMSHEVWSEYYDRLTALIEQHKTTLIFVNTRRMAERLARELSERARRGRGHRASRQPVEREAARRRNAPQERTAEGARRHGVARARHRHRPRRSRLPDRIAASHRHVSPAGRAVGPHGGGHAEGPAVSSVARRSHRVRGAAPRRCVTASSIASCRTTRRSTCWRSRSSPKPRARTTPKTSCSRWFAAPGPIGRLTRDAVRRGRADDLGRIRHEARTARSALMHRDEVQRAAARPARRAQPGDHVGGAIPEVADYRVFSIRTTRSSARSTRTSPSRARPAT